MTNTRPSRGTRALVLFVMLGCAGGVTAQQQTAAEPSVVVASNPPSSAVPPPTNAQPASEPHKRSSTSRTAMAGHARATDATTGLGNGGDRYGANPHALLDPYQKAVTPPVESGR